MKNLKQDRKSLDEDLKINPGNRGSDLVRAGGQTKQMLYRKLVKPVNLEALGSWGRRKKESFRKISGGCKKPSDPFLYIRTYLFLEIFRHLYPYPLDSTHVKLCSLCFIGFEMNFRRVTSRTLMSTINKIEKETNRISKLLN